MANHLDLEEQEQLEEIKHFWKRYGNAITWLLIAVLGAFAAWNGYQYWQRNQASQASAMYDEVERAIRGGEAAKVERAFADMKDRFGPTAYAQQAGLLVAKSLYELGQPDSAKAALGWVADKSSDKGYASIAKLRLAGLHLESKSYEEALKVLDSGVTPEFSALAADRRGDVLAAQGKKTEAVAQYQAAFKAADLRSDYRRMVEVKFNALGVNPAEGTN
jgi:predicted negative regulator of RcsB-dependent stress response